MKNIPYKNFPDYVLRTPLLPFNYLTQILEQPLTDEDLISIISDSKILEAVLVASPSLHERFLEWREGKLSSKRVENLKIALMKYLLRMGVRPTPYGLFSGISCGSFDNQYGTVELVGGNRYSRHTRLDMNYLCALAQDLAKKEEILEKLLYYPNSSLYRVGDQLRYVEFRYREAERTHHIVAVDYSEYLQRVLDKARDGAVIKDLAEVLIEGEITFKEAKEFILELINNQVLVHDLEPATTGPEFMDQMIDRLDSLGQDKGGKDALTSISQILNDMDKSEIGTTIPLYDKIKKELKELKTEFNPKFLFQTDMKKEILKSGLHQSLVNEIMEGIVFLNKMNPQIRESAPVQKFKEDFTGRYETRELPLIKVLDTEIGISYAQSSGTAGDFTPLVDDLALPPRAGEDNPQWSRYESFLLKKMQQVIKEDLYKIELTDEDFKDNEANWNNLPLTFATMVEIVKNKGDDQDNYNTVLTGFGGSSGGNLLGRFCFADQGVDKLVKDMMKKEQRIAQDKILAEIVHLPQARLGNILLRPVLRDYEIPYLARSYVKKENRIMVEDLMVSVKQNRIVLRSKRLNKEVIPRLTTAHNFNFGALPVYQFLADLQTQGLRGGLGFGWSNVGNEFNFLPRVTYKNLIFAKASWKIKKEDIKELLKEKDSDKLLKDIENLREQNKIPRYVKLVAGDNKLFIDLANILCIRTLFSEISNSPVFQLEEFLFDEEKPVVKSQDDFFTNEFIISFYRDELKNETNPEQKN